MTSTALPGTNPSEHSGATTAPDFGDPRAEFHALLSGCGLYDLSGRSKIAVTGGDRVRWMNGMVSNNVRDLAQGHGVYAFMLNAQGRIQADLYVFQRGDSLLVDTEGGQREKVLQLFDHYIIADDVEVADISDNLTALGLTGPESRHVLERAGISVPDLAPLEFCSPKCDCACGCLQCTLVRGDDSAGTSYEIWLAPDKQKSTWEALVAAGATAVGAGALELRRINFGIPRYGVDIRERDLPQETGQTRALNFTKGCYLGQEIVERIRSRGAVHRQFAAFALEGKLPDPGVKILAGENKDEKEVGEITSSAILPLPSGDRAVALGYLRREATGKDLRAGTAKLKPTSLPIG
ncbi:MAG: folate-binding protein [Terriglobales bacterium]|jgi:folate-binding protein YgfZ